MNTLPPVVSLKSQPSEIERSSKIMPVLLKVFIIPDPTPYFAGGVEDIIALVFEGQKNASPTPEMVSITPISISGVLIVNLLKSTSAVAVSASPIDEIALKPNLSDRIPPIGPTSAEAPANGIIRYRSLES